MVTAARVHETPAQVKQPQKNGKAIIKRSWSESNAHADLVRQVAPGTIVRASTVRSWSCLPLCAAVQLLFARLPSRGAHRSQVR